MSSNTSTRAKKVGAVASLLAYGEILAIPILLSRRGVIVKNVQIGCPSCGSTDFREFGIDVHHDIWGNICNSCERVWIKK